MMNKLFIVFNYVNKGYWKDQNKNNSNLRYYYTTNGDKDNLSKILILKK